MMHTKRGLTHPSILLFTLVVALSFLGGIAPNLQVEAAGGALANHAMPSFTTVLASQDTWIDKNQANHNFGSCDQLTIDTSQGSLGNGRMLLRFDLAALPANAQIVSATMQLTKTGGATASHNLEAHPLTAAWDEGIGDCSGVSGEASWSKRLPGTGWDTQGGDYDPQALDTVAVSADGVYTWDVTSAVQGWTNSPATNFGLLIGTPDSGTDSYAFGSREHSDPSLRPKLTVTYLLTAVLPALTDTGMVQRDS